MHTEHMSNGRNYLIVQVPKDASRFVLRNDIMFFDVALKYKLYNDESSLKWKSVYKNLPSGQYRILFVAEEATPEQAAEVVEKNWDGDLDKGPNGYGGEGWMAECGYWNYEAEDFDDFPKEAAIDSLQSLIRSKFTDHANHKHLVIEKID